MAMVDSVMVSHWRLTASVKPWLKNPQRIDQNILNSVAQEGCGTDIILKCRVNLGVMGLRPPPGGAEQQSNVVFSTNFQNLSLRSQRNPLSTNRRSNSIGGQAPYFSRAGIFTSSMKIHVDRPGLAPSNAFLIFSSFPSIVS